jgi:hypothetical protein
MTQPTGAEATWWPRASPRRALPGTLGRLDQSRLQEVESEHAQAIARRPLANGELE